MNVVGMAKSMGKLKGGSIAITGYIDMTGITMGLNSLKGALGESKAKSKEAKGDFQGLTDTLSNMLGPLGKIGTAVVGATVGLAALGPAAAPALARMQVSFFELTRTLSESLAPAFETFADLFQGFVSWVEGDGKPVMESLNSVIVSIGKGLEQVGIFAGQAAVALGGISQTVSVIFDATFGTGAAASLMKFLVEHGALPAAAALLGFQVGGPVGALVAGGGMLFAQEAGNLQNPIKEERKASGALAGAVVGALWGAGIGSLVPGIGTVVGAILGGLGGAIGGMGTAAIMSPQAQPATTSSSAPQYQYSNTNSGTWPDGYPSEKYYEKEQQDLNGFIYRNR